MTAPPSGTPPPPERPEPGDRPPPGTSPGRLARPPSARYATGPGVGPASTGGWLGRLRALGPAIVAGLITAGLLVVVGGVLAEQRGLLAIAGLGGAVVGLLAAGAAVSPDGSTSPALARAGAVRAAVGLAIVAVASGAIGTWAYGRLEGGVLDPLTYLWSVFGLFIPAEAAIAALAAAWGAGAGPVRLRS